MLHFAFYHGLCDSNKLLYKRCAKSMGKPKIRPPLLWHFSTDVSETQNQERYPGYDPACEIWLMWNDGLRKRVCENGEFWLTFGSFIFCTVRVTSRSRPMRAQNACFCARKCFLGSRW